MIFILVIYYEKYFYYTKVRTDYEEELADRVRTSIRRLEEKCRASVAHNMPAFTTERL